MSPSWSKRPGIRGRGFSRRPRPAWRHASPLPDARRAAFRRGRRLAGGHRPGLASGWSAGIRPATGSAHTADPGAGRLLRASQDRAAACSSPVSSTRRPGYLRCMARYCGTIGPAGTAGSIMDKYKFPVKVSVQRVPVTCAVLEQDRRGLRLPGSVAHVQPPLQAVRPRRWPGPAGSTTRGRSEAASDRAPASARLPRQGTARRSSGTRLHRSGTSPC